MTDRKTPAEDSDIIEGVAVDKTGASSGTGRKRRSSGKAPSEKQASRTRGADKAGGSGGGASEPGQQTDSPAARARGGGRSMAALMAAAAILIAGAGVAIQEWRTMARVQAFHAEIAALEGRLEVAETAARSAEDEAARLSGQISGRLAALEAAMPDDPKVALNDLAAVQDDFGQRLQRLETAPAPAAGGVDGSQMALAQSALTVASAMLADSLAGGDAGRWLPVLEELNAAGLDLDNLESFQAALSPPPPSTSQLLASATAMMPTLRDSVRDRSGGWWSSTADTLAGFVTLRRQDQSDTPPSADGGTPLASFADAIAGGRLEDALAASAELAAAMPDQAVGLNGWRISAERRLAADAALARFSADMAARLTASGAVERAE